MIRSQPLASVDASQQDLETPDDAKEWQALVEDVQPTIVEGDRLLRQLRERTSPRFFVISGPSGVGKDAILQELKPRFPEVFFAVTATTRAPRPGEVDGRDYIFLSQYAFLEKQAEDEFLESAMVYGQDWYGVPKWGIRQALAENRSVVVKVDVQGAASIKELLPDSRSIFVAPESMTALLRQLRNRKTELREKVVKRFRTACLELRDAQTFDYLVVNESDRLEVALERISQIFEAEFNAMGQPGIRI